MGERQYMKLANRIFNKLVEKNDSKTVTFTVQREMWKGYIAECEIIVEVDEDAKNSWIEKQKRKIEDEAVGQGKAFKETDKEVQKNIKERTADFVKEIQEMIPHAIKSMADQYIHVSRDGSIDYNNRDEVYPFITCKIVENGREITHASDINNWEYDEGEVSINKEVYGKLR